MAVQAVYLEADAFLVCLNHALSTEKEEVMGLCIGEGVGNSKKGCGNHSAAVLIFDFYVRTQAMYQMMDQGFVGLIFSCFIEDKNTKTGRILYTCFQSIQAQKSSEYERIEIPIHVVPHETIGKVCLESAVELPKILCQEEQDAYRRIHRLFCYPCEWTGLPHMKGFRVFTKNLCSQMSAISGPLLQWLEDRLEQNKQRVQDLQQEKEQLLEELAALE
ncbi:lys-63-specific deubiquitinase BRCC36 isoform X3 [Amazona aestiva]|uniref:Lys-63-specific deubiquitinase BRCC36 isoform X3 n=1 Tax=Amazona aestiva TaxID=12930 RepID=A0A0Q3X674_AMAAE|nr:lys-63-specific deubiquitinase BRCC36 isoform X3 [Amazona aestiva]